MAAGTVRIEDIIVPEIFTPYVQQITQEKSRLISSGAVVASPKLAELLAGGGLTFNTPSFKDLDNDEENVSTDDPTTNSTPNKLGTAQEISVRLNRNQSWSTMDLAATLAGADPAMAIANRVGSYWLRRQQAVFLATMKGVFADNDAAPAATEHTQYDLTHDVSGASFVDGVTNFSAENFLDACQTMGDSQDALGLVMVHSVVYNRMQKNNMIDFVPDAIQQVNIPYFLGRQVVVDDGMPQTGGVFESWLFGAGSVGWAAVSPEMPTEIDRKPSAGNGSGQTVLHNRVQWCIHPAGHAYVGTSPVGGPSNAATSNNLANAGSWKRIWTERKMIRIARLKTREY